MTLTTSAGWRALRQLLLASCLGLVCLSPAAAHPFYVTICQIDHNPQTQAIEITFKFFTDDLEQALDAHAKTRLFLGTEQELERTDAQLFDYLTSRVQLEVDGQPTELRFVGKEVEPDVTWAYLEAVDIATPSRVTVTNRILLDIFDSQTNIVHVKVSSEQKSLLLREGAISGTLEF